MTLNWQEAKGWLTLPERKALHKYAYNVVDGGTIVNIGVEYGASVICFLDGKQEKTKVVAIDVDLSPWIEQYPTARFRGLAIYERDSAEYGEKWPFGQTVDLLFVDGDHSYKGVWEDLLSWYPNMAVGGHIICHDCYDWPPAPPKTPRPPCPDVNRAVSEWYATRIDGVRELDFVDSMRIFKVLA